MRNRNHQRQEPVMKKTLVPLILVCAALLVVGQAGAARNGAATKTVTVAMHDPGCHWFQVGTKFLKSMSVTGPVRLLNVDEATLKVVGPKGLQLARIGKKIALGRGVYHITMVGQAPDDNHLILRVK
jgi:hypothetical protein